MSKATQSKGNEPHMQNQHLTAEQQSVINQVAATMEIENMPLTQRCYENLGATATGEKTVEEVIAEILRRYAHA